MTEGTTAYIGIDVGTGAARAGIFGAAGDLIAHASAPIQTFVPRPDFAQHSSADIWQACCHATREAVAHAGIAADDVKGIGFDATCSLVVSGPPGRPISVDPEGTPGQDIIVWHDHRALEDAAEINRLGGEPLDYVGGRISPEMQVPKMRWLRRELPEVFRSATGFWDLPDWLVHRATGAASRSLCSVVCKWTYLGHKGTSGEGWQDDFLTAAGLGDLVDEGYARIGTEFLAPGQIAGGLTDEAAEELGLPAGTPVGASLIDAYAGALGTLRTGGEDWLGRLAIIAGTSTCHICLSEDPVFVPGVWGPYHGALVGDLWASEGGQSAAGALIDTVLTRHGAYAALKDAADAGGRSVHDLLVERLADMAEETATLTARRHVLPDIMGNRSPLAEPWRLGGITGISQAVDAGDLALDYLATIQSLGYGTRHIVEEMRAAGHEVTALVFSGGLARNPLFIRETADICGLPVLIPSVEEPVLLGSAMLGAVAAGAFADTAAAAGAMAPTGATVEPRGEPVAGYHDRKYRVFRKMQADFAEIEEMMGRETR